MDQELIAYLDRRFADLDGRFADLDGRFADLDRRFSERFDQQDRRFDQQDRRIEELAESHRHTQVVVEGLRSDVQAVAEGVAMVDQKLERYREAIDRRRDRDQATVQAGFKTLRRKDSELDRRVTRLETGLPPR